MITSVEMDTTQIVCALKSDSIARKRFCGVFPLNLLPKVLDTFPCGFVANTDPSNEPGNIGSYSISNQSGKENFSTAMENRLTITMKHLKNT